MNTEIETGPAGQLVHPPVDIARLVSEGADTVVIGPASGDAASTEPALEEWVARFWGYGYELDVVRTARLRQAWLEACPPVGPSRGPAAFARSPADLAETFRRVESVEGWLLPAEMRFLFAAARQASGAEAIVEIGSWKGRSTATLALGALAGSGAPVFAVDHHHGEHGMTVPLGVPLADIRSWRDFRSNLHALRLEDAVTPVLKDSLAAAAAWDGPPIGLLWIDGGHDYEIAAGDLAAWSRHVRPGGIVAVHDTTNLDGPRRAVEDAVAQGRLRGPVRIDSITFGLAPETAPEDDFPRLPPRPERHERISLIVTTRNEGDGLRKTIDSLLANTFYPEFEVLVLDDASEDGSCDFLLAPPYAGDRRLRLVRQDSPRGYLALRIEGARLASGSILQFLDAHHCFSPYWLTNLYDRLRRHDFRVLVGPAVSLLDEATWTPAPGIGYGLTADLRQGQSFPLDRDAVGPGGVVPVLAGHQLMLSRQAYDTIGGWCPLFQGHGSEDTDLCFRAFLLGFDCLVEPSALMAHLHKPRFTNPVSWGQWRLNQCLVTYLNFGAEAFESLKRTLADLPGCADGLAAFEHVRPEAEAFRRRIVHRQRRSAEELLARLVPVEAQSLRQVG